MKKCVASWSVFIFAAFLLLSTMYCEGLRPNPDATMESNNDRGNRRKEQDSLMPKGTAEDGVLKELYATGSSMPDCSHACGPCFPCKTVMVSLKCSVAESCPIVYRCMCKGRYYHIPSS